jgi:hypothetical protein
MHQQEAAQGPQWQERKGTVSTVPIERFLPNPEWMESAKN